LKYWHASICCTLPYLTHVTNYITKLRYLSQCQDTHCEQKEEIIIFLLDSFQGPVLSITIALQPPCNGKRSCINKL